MDRGKLQRAHCDRSLESPQIAQQVRSVQDLANRQMDLSEKLGSPFKNPLRHPDFPHVGRWPLASADGVPIDGDALCVWIQLSWGMMILRGCG